MILEVLLKEVLAEDTTVWCLGGNGGMDYRDDYWGLYRDYYRDAFPHSLLSTRETSKRIQLNTSGMFLKPFKD